MLETQLLLGLEFLRGCLTGQRYALAALSEDSASVTVIKVSNMPQQPGLTQNCIKVISQGNDLFST